jgi:pimeloyl-ACP methyl ester carboxylesterase
MTTRSAASPRTEMAPLQFARAWGAQGWVSDLDGPVHWVEFAEGTDQHAPPAVFVHGLGGSHLNWVRIGPDLAAGRRAMALDLAGFGLSAGAGRDCSVQGNARLLHRFLVEVVGAPAVLVGNSMGSAVSVLAAAAHPEAVAGLVLVDPALPAQLQIPDAVVAGLFLLYGAPVLGEVFMRVLESRLSARQQVERVMRVCFADPQRASEPVMAALAALAEHRRSVTGKERWFLQAARSLMRLLARPTAYRAVLRGLAAPTLLIHGEADRLVPIAAARAAAADNARWSTSFIPGVGHTPQLECPEAVVEAMSGWLARHPGLTVR